jgi:hypothetical protein
MSEAEVGASAAPEEVAAGASAPPEAPVPTDQASAEVSAQSNETMAEPSAPPAQAPSRPGEPAVVAVREGLAADELLAVLGSVFPAGTPSRHWCACLDTIGPLADGHPTDLAGWSEGRAWGARAEVRWQQAADGRYRVLYLGDGDTLPDGFTALDADLRAEPGEETAGVYLWGARGDDGRYHTTRLPRPLEYPGIGATASDNREPRVPYRVLSGADGVARFVRLALAEEG